jgi:hypothetical protein
VLVRQLPPESAVSTELRLEQGDAPPTTDHDPETEQWSRTEHLLAAIRDELNSLRWAFISSKAKQKPKWKPEPTPRPGVKPKRKRPRLNQTQTSALAQYLERTQGEPEAHAADN